jgi:hypothetical protein
MTGWGSVIAIEAQERIYYALAGNIAINNCFNAIAMHAAISSEPGIMLIPTPDYLVPSSFGSLELKPSAETEFIGQPIDYSAGKTVAGARQTIERSRPIFLVESIKAGRERLRGFLSDCGYKVVEAGINLLAIHKTDPVVNELQIPDMPAQSSAA